MIDDTGESLTAEDRAHLAAIHEAHDPSALAALVHAYYRDADRADRTPRALLYMHLGLLAGRLERQAQAHALRLRNGTNGSSDHTP